jgi:GNAT superfamily N-acetyltransferase
VTRVNAASLYELRRRVLRGNDSSKTVADPRDDDPTSFHFGGFLDDRLVVSASFFLSTSTLGDHLGTYQLRYMATDAQQQGSGYGALVLTEAAETLAALGVRQLWANARDTALGFYRATGWTILKGTEHLSAETLLPHTVIVKSLVDEA